MPKKSLAQAAGTLARRIDQLARVSDVPGQTTRTFLSPAMGRANALVGAWMKAAGLSVRVDAVGNLIGRTRGPGKGAKTLILGSHLDTVVDAGRFDGPLGVLLPIAALEVLHARGVELPFTVEVVGFSEEEGVRFSSAYLGSKGYTGSLKKADLRLRDAKGISVATALAASNGARLAMPTGARSRNGPIGYVEVHIEQGPVLEACGLAVGVVSAISGQTRATVTFHGKAGHAGTTPMGLRRDALCGAAEFVLAVEQQARAGSPLVATVGRIAARPGAANVIAGSAELSLDLRHPVDSRRKAAFKRLARVAREIARRRRLSISIQILQDNNAVRCSPDLTRRLGASVRRYQGRLLSLESGAGHDAVVLSGLAPVAMLFVRCRAGLSHHPDEFVSKNDLKSALAVVVDFLGNLGPRSSR